MWLKNKRNRWLIAICLVLGVGISGTAWFWNAGANLISRADPENTQLVTLGQSVYAQNCASCHGANLGGQPDWRVRNSDNRMPAPPHDETGHTWHHPDNILFGITKKGISGYAPAGYESDMPAFGEELTDEEIWATLAFIKSRWNKTTQTRQSARNEGEN